MRIERVEDMVNVMERLGMRKTVTPYNTSYRFAPHRGKGYMEFTGALDWWFYLDMDYECAADTLLEYDLTEPYISLSISDNSDVVFSPETEMERLLRIGNFYINTAGLHHTLHCPAGQRQRRKNIIIRASAYSQYLFPALMNHPFGDMLALISGAGQCCRPYIAKIVTEFQLSPYRDEAFKMQLNTVVTGFFTELIHQSGLLLEAKKLRVGESDQALIAQAQEIIRQNLLEPPTIDMLARRVAMNRKKLQLCFQEITGMTIGDYLRACRMEKAMEMLHTDMLIKDVAHAVGYASPGRFSQAFEGMYKMTPKEFRAGV